jgi:hypothetical protein
MNLRWNLFVILLCSCQHAPSGAPSVSTQAVSQSAAEVRRNVLAEQGSVAKARQHADKIGQHSDAIEQHLDKVDYKGSRALRILDHP